MAEIPIVRPADIPFAPIASAEYAHVRDVVLARAAKALQTPLENLGPIVQAGSQAAGALTSAVGDAVAAVGAITGFYQGLAATLEKGRAKSIENMWKAQGDLLRPRAFYTVTPYPHGRQKSLTTEAYPGGVPWWESVVAGRRIKSPVVGGPSLQEIINTAEVGCLYRHVNLGRDTATRSVPECYKRSLWWNGDRVTEKFHDAASPEVRGRTSVDAAFEFAGWQGGVIGPAEVWPLSPLCYPFAVAVNDMHASSFTPAAAAVQLMLLSPTPVHCSVPWAQVEAALRSLYAKVVFVERDGQGGVVRRVEYKDMDVLPAQQVDHFMGVDTDGVPFQTHPEKYEWAHYDAARTCIRAIHQFAAVRHRVLSSPGLWSPKMKAAALESGDADLERAATGKPVEREYVADDPLFVRSTRPPRPGVGTQPGRDPVQVEPPQADQPKGGSTKAPPVGGPGGVTSEVPANDESPWRYAAGVAAVGAIAVGAAALRARRGRD